MTGAVKDFELTLKLRNNQLRARRIELGLTMIECARRVSISYNLYCRYENLRESPISNRAHQLWKPTAERIAAFFGVAPEVLFPAAVLAVEQPTVVAEIEGERLAALAAWQSGMELPPAPDELLEERQEVEALSDALATLPPRERFVLQARADGKTLQALGEELKLSREHVRQIEDKSLKNLRSAFGAPVQTKRKLKMWGRPPGIRQRPADLQVVLNIMRTFRRFDDESAEALLMRWLLRAPVQATDAEVWAARRTCRSHLKASVDGLEHTKHAGRGQCVYVTKVPRGNVVKYWEHYETAAAQDMEDSNNDPRD